MQRKQKSWIYFFIILALASLPLCMPGMEGRTGQDLGFHLNRIEAIAKGMEEGIFFAKVQRYWFSGYGYPTPIYYGDLLLYIPAFFRIMGLSVINAYKLFVVFVHGLTIGISYKTFKTAFQKDRIAWILAGAYTLSSYRFLDLYIRGAVGEYLGIAFMPLIGLAMYSMYTKERMSAEEGKKNIVYLVIGMSGLIGSHLLSTEMVVVTMGILCLVFWKKTFQKENLLIYIKAVGLSLLCNLYFIVPFLDYYLHEDVYIKVRMAKEQLIQEDGAYPWQFLAFFQNPFGTIISNHEDIMAFHTGLFLMFALLVGLIVLVRKKANKKIKVFLIMAAVLLWVSSGVFPWDGLETKVPMIGKILVQVQFPWRYLSILCLVLCFLWGELFLINEKLYIEKKYLFLLLVSILLSPIFFTSQYVKNYEPVFYQERSDLDASDVGYFEYLRTGSKIKKLKGEVKSKGIVSYEVIEDSEKAMVLAVSTEKKDGWIQVPILNYRGYHAVDDNGKELAITDGKYKEIKIKLPANYAGRIEIAFKQPWYWIVAEIVSAITAVCLLCYIYIFKKPFDAFVDKN